MATQAQNFAQYMKHTWEGTAHGHEEENAILVAQRQHAKRVRDFATTEFIHVEGDIPAGLWQWPDESQYVIFDNGSGIHAVNFPGNTSRTRERAL